MDTKNVKRKIDDDTVDRLVENRVSKKNAQRKANKKKKAGLSILITALAAVLVFVVFFVGSYIFFTSGSSENDIEELPSFEDVVKEDNETEENKEANEETVEGELLLERPSAPKPSDDPNVLGEDEEEEEEEKKSEAKPEKKPESEEKTEKKPQSKPQPQPKPQPKPEEKPQPKPQPEPKPPVEENKVVEKNEDSEAIVIE